MTKSPPSSRRAWRLARAVSALAVVEVVNRREGRPFTEDDLRRLEALLTALALTLLLTWRNAGRAPSPARSAAKPAAQTPPRTPSPGSVPTAQPQTTMAPTPVPSSTRNAGTVSLLVSISPASAKARLTVAGQTYEGTETLLVLARALVAPS